MPASAILRDACAVANSPRESTVDRTRTGVDPVRDESARMPHDPRSSVAELDPGRLHRGAVGGQRALDLSWTPTASCAAVPSLNSSVEEA
jgi:hypothetical protein